MKRFVSLLLSCVLLLGLIPTVFADSYNDKVEAVVQTAVAFYLKNPYMQYDSINFTSRSEYDGGLNRNNRYITPEDATSQRNIYTVCSSYCFEVYWNALGYELLGGSLGCVTKNMFVQEGKIVAYRYHKSDGTPLDQALSQFRRTLQPGDVIVYVGSSGSGHAMMYVGDFDGDGTADLLHSTGKKYNMETGVDAVEVGGNITKTPAADMWTEGKGQYLGKREGFAILRPLAADAAACDITPAARGRMKYPGLAIERKASCGLLGSPEEGGELTYTVSVTNHSQNNYVLPIQETVPEGTTLKEAPGATVKGNTLTWELPLVQNQTGNVTYTVTVNAKRGQTIVCGGGNVGGIPSNVLSNRVSGKKVDEVRLKDSSRWIPAVTEEKTGGINFAEQVYRHALGIDLDLPAAAEVVSTLFRKADDNGRFSYYRKDRSPDNLLNEMVVDGGYGGYYVLTKPEEFRTRELRKDHLEPGDIFLVSASFNGTAPDTYVFTGDQLLGATNGRVSSVSSATLVSRFKDSVFMILRPSLAYDDIGKSRAAVSFPDVKESDWFYGYVMDLAKEGIVGGMSDGTFQPAGTLTYGQALKLLICALDKDVGNASSGHWASGYLSAAQSKGWISGSVNLDAGVSRLAFCQIAAKAKGLTEQPESNPFTDTSDPAVLALNKAGVIGGMGEGKFSPDTTLTRAQISKIIVELRKA